MNLRPFNFHKTGFYQIWNTLTQWRYAKVFAFVLFVLWVKDGEVEPTVFMPLTVAIIGCLALASLLDVVLMLIPAKTVSRLTRTAEEQEAWEKLGALEASR